MRSTRKYIKNGIAFLALGAVLTTGLTLGWVSDSAAQRNSNRQTQEETYRQLNLFGDVFERVRAEYVDPVTDKELIEAAINGMLTNLDPHSSFLDGEDFKDMQVQTRGEFGGLGIEVTMEDGLVKVVSPIDDTPAFRAGIEANDRITHLDGEQVMGLTLSDAVKRMRGKVGTAIELTVLREGKNEPIKFSITRDVIKIQSVRHHMEGEDVGYIRITTFNEQTQTGLENALKDIKKQAGDKLIGVVLDMRNNPGGLLDQAISVADTFLDQGEIVSTRGRNENDIQRSMARSGELAEGLPIVVLVNGGSASASEIVAGALQDHRRAIVMGTQTFGKGSVQTIVSLGNQGAMRLTTARYYTPSGRSIQAKGIEPDIIVPAALIENLKDERPSEADLRGALDKDKNATPKKNDDKAVTPTAEGEKAEPEKVDYQLSRAIDLLRGLQFFQKKGAAVQAATP